MRYVTYSINRKPAVKRVEGGQIVQMVELIIFAPLAQLVSASPCHGEGQGFESPTVRQVFAGFVYRLGHSPFT